MRRIPEFENPEITWAERTGYPQWSQPVEYKCDFCGEFIDNDMVYSDENYDCLCEYCLLNLHKKVEVIELI